MTGKSNFEKSAESGAVDPAFRCAEPEKLGVGEYTAVTVKISSACGQRPAKYTRQCPACVESCWTPVEVPDEDDRKWSADGGPSADL